MSCDEKGQSSFVIDIEEDEDIEERIDEDSDSEPENDNNKSFDRQNQQSKNQNLQKQTIRSTNQIVDEDEEELIEDVDDDEVGENDEFWQKEMSKYAMDKYNKQQQTTTIAGDDDNDINDSQETTFDDVPEPEPDNLDDGFDFGFIPDIPAVVVVENKTLIDTKEKNVKPPVKVPGTLTPEEIQQIDQMEILHKKQVEQLHRLSPQLSIFPALRLSSYHTIGFKLSANYKAGDEFKPYPDQLELNWDNNNVPMPWDWNYTFNVKVRTGGRDDNGKEIFVNKAQIVWERFEDAFTKLKSTSPLTCEGLEKAMKYYKGIERAKNIKCLEYAIEDIMTDEERKNFFNKVLPVMIDLCLNGKEIVTTSIPLLKRFMNHSITLSQKQIACLLSLAFFSLYPLQLEDDKDYSEINFGNKLFHGDFDDPEDRKVSQKKGQKIRCILHYFERIADEMPKGIVTYTRKSIYKLQTPDWEKSNKELKKLHILNKGSIETEGQGFLQVDFANKYIGGGVLGRGCVQEEILFVIYPELLLSMLFTQYLTSNEALLVTGCERFSNYSGYASNFQYNGDFIDTNPWDENGRKCTQIIMIDALYIRKSIDQYHQKNLLRELNKAFVGFSTPKSIINANSKVAVASGKWGCGAFNGSPVIKALIQLLAASQADRDLIFFTFGDRPLSKELQEIYTSIKDMTIGKIFGLLAQYDTVFCTNTTSPSFTLKEFICEFTTCTNVVENMDEEESLDGQKSQKPSTSTANPNLKKTQFSITDFYEPKPKPKESRSNSDIILSKWFKESEIVQNSTPEIDEKVKDKILISSMIPGFGDTTEEELATMINNADSDEVMEIDTITSINELPPRKININTTTPKRTNSLDHKTPSSSKKSPDTDIPAKKPALMDFFG